jgi:hypothetical protein
MKTISKLIKEPLRIELFEQSELFTPEVQIVGLKYSLIYGMIQVFADVFVLDQNEVLPERIENVPLYELIAGEAHQAPPICSGKPKQRK